MRRVYAMLVAACALAGVAAAGRHVPSASHEPLDARPAGEATAQVHARSVLAAHVPGLTDDERLAFAIGRRLFAMSWVEAPASVEGFDGLGPFFSSRSCSGCHAGTGRGRPPEGPDDISSAMLVRLGATDAAGRRHADPRYGGYLSARAVRGLAPEARLVVSWESVEHVYPSGERTMLRRPRFDVADAAYGPLAHGVRVSARIAPAVFGVGLLESVPDSVLFALADPDDADGDGISGRVHWLDAAGPGAASGARLPGRFGWKAVQPSLASQVSAALAEDLGITSPTTPELELTAVQFAAHQRARGGEPELAGAALQALVDYCRWLAVPAPRDPGDAAVRRGADRFRDLGCASCHVATLPAGDASVGAMSRQMIRPYSDLLLHDMGPGLSDGMPEGDAGPSEWRTPPLWGIGLAGGVTGPRHLLHDGRARNSEEAILWHDGEARRSREAFRALPAGSRRDLIRFLESL